MRGPSLVVVVWFLAVGGAVSAQEDSPPAIAESSNACGAGAAARGVWLLGQRSGRPLPPEWKSPDDVYQFLLKAMKTVAEKGTNTDNFNKGKELASQEFARVNPGWRIRTTVRALQDQDDPGNLKTNANAASVFARIAAALKDKTKVVEVVTADWNGSIRDGGHCFLVTGIESQVVGQGDAVQTCHRLVGVDDLDQTDGKPGADPIASEWFDANGLQIDLENPEPVDRKTFQGSLVSVAFIESVVEEVDEFAGLDGLLSARVEDARRLKNSRVVSRSGHAWSLVGRVPGGDGQPREVWRDDATGKLWSDALDRKDYARALALAGEPASFSARGWIGDRTWRAPNRREWEEADRHGLREVLPRLVNTLFWVASDAPGRPADGNAEVYFGNSGRIGTRDADSPIGVRFVAE